MTQTRDIILHIGHFKTGTTALQVFCANNAEGLAGLGLHYAQTARHHDKHSTLPLTLLHEAGAHKMMFSFDPVEDSDALWDIFLEEARMLPEGHALLISSEELIRLAAYPGAVERFRALVERTPDIRIRAIAYLRAPQDHLESYYNQLIKMGRDVPGFDATVCHWLEPVHWDYALALHPWLEILGPRNVMIRQFTDDLRNEDAIYADFLAALDKPMLLHPVGSGRDPNPKLDPRLLPLQRGLGRSDLKPRHIRDVVESARETLAAEAGTGLGGGPDFAAIAKRSREGLELLAALPNASIDLPTMLDALPRALDDGQRKMDESVAMLSAEIGRLRSLVLSQQARIAKLEGALGDDGPDRPRGGRGRKRRKDPEA
ncbi:hypothetical protein [Pararhodobacter sp. CCB-MM2]|uniref:hypothetical protein n=1 Tax=Pararhodobacter sp. CCB-MM2 TaxID=1786003 RepID=UPI000836C720|nr:hypothetical protein [Pararhodobacter sp. CCB-MM2]